MPCIGNVPTIVASGTIQWTGASHASTTIFTPSVAGTYRVSLYLSPEPHSSYPAGSPTEILQLTWTDSNSGHIASANQSGGSNAPTDTPYTILSLLLQSATSAIQFSASSGAAVVTYDLYYVVEQLS
jgi:hypothetical protein